MTLKEKRIVQAYEYLNTLYQMRQTEDVKAKIRYYEKELNAELEDISYKQFHPKSARIK